MSTQTRPGTGLNRLSLKLRNNWLSILILLVIVAAVAVMVPSFFQPSNMLNVGRQVRARSCSAGSSVTGRAPSTNGKSSWMWNSSPMPRGPPCR